MLTTCLTDWKKSKLADWFVNHMAGLNRDCKADRKTTEKQKSEQSYE